MRRSRSTTSANEPRARLHKLPCKTRHILRRSHIDIPAIHRPRHPRIRHRRQRQIRHTAHLFNHAQHRRRPRAAIATHCVRAPLRQLLGSRLGRRSIQAIALFVHRHHHDHRQPRSLTLRRKNRLLRLPQRSHRLDNQHVRPNPGPTLGQRPHLFRKRHPSLIQTHLTQRLQSHSQRPNRPCYISVAGLLLLYLRYTLPRQFHSCHVNRANLVLQTIPLQPESIRAKSIRLNQLRARLQILRVHPTHHLRLRQVQLIKAAIDEHTARIQHRAHGPVAQHRIAAAAFGRKQALHRAGSLN